MIGAFVADSMGSLEEFEQDPVPEERLANSLAMPGGGPHRVGPGQITDDSEMAMCMAYGITKSERQPGIVQIDMNNIAEFYKEWINSLPFDIGFTTRDALGPLSDVKDPTDYCRVAKTMAYMNNK